ncbi:hypothetical protein E4O01_00930 [Treponema sp. OMZ 790]|nr:MULTISPECIES: glycerophosphodiester phosphodiesterase family protein [unclassified Treponema]UTC70000.1 hypothetical protein E4O01_00930 [Treponema sp. OMZ 790]UTC72715.1 hypothetical protein E4O02_00930 [Treponema sp. OMZ 791]
MVSSKELLEYAKIKYPEIKTGFVFFFALGDTGKFDANYIILEEDAASSSTLNKIHKAGKFAIVWTVNKEKSMEKFVGEDVDGIITDDVKSLKEIMAKRNHRSDLEILLDLINR